MISKSPFRLSFVCGGYWIRKRRQRRKPDRRLLLVVLQRRHHPLRRRIILVLRPEVRGLEDLAQLDHGAGLGRAAPRPLDRLPITINEETTMRFMASRSGIYAAERTRDRSIEIVHALIKWELGHASSPAGVGGAVRASARARPGRDGRGVRSARSGTRGSGGGQDAGQPR